MTRRRRIRMGCPEKWAVGHFRQCWYEDRRVGYIIKYSKAGYLPWRTKVTRDYGRKISEPKKNFQKTFTDVNQRIKGRSGLNKKQPWSLSSTRPRRTWSGGNSLVSSDRWLDIECLPGSIWPNLHRKAKTEVSKEFFEFSHSKRKGSVRDVLKSRRREGARIL